MTDLLLLVAIGLLSGALASSLGIGGGIVFVPSLVLVLQFDQHLAQGTSLAVILPTAIVGAIGHSKAKRIDWRIGIPAAISGLLGGIGGSQLALAMDPDRLRRLFAIALFVIAARLAVRARRLYLDRPSSRAPAAGQ